ncbi:MAG: serine/threonine-protein kinase, partial [Anaerolineae bacterium]|nr:serine/threonine-protein kinase [Anaerolineae bacterium]
MEIDNLSGRQLGPYELHELLGVGGMGVVYRAYQPKLKRWVAIKVLSTMTLRRVNYVERFHREAETAGSLEHRHIIPIYDYGTERGTYYVVMRLLEGGTLDERMAQHVHTDTPLPSLGEIADVLDQLASALDYAHSRGVIHRDIKPSNIMFDTQGSAYIVDFGIAKLLETTETLTRSGVSLGTPVYMSPEQWRAEALGPATDQYALGGMAYTLVTGHLPFEVPTAYAQMHKHLHEDPIPPRVYRPELPEALGEVLAIAMAKDPDDRFPTVTAFANALTEVILEDPGEYTGYFAGPLLKKPLFAFDGYQPVESSSGAVYAPIPTPLVTMPEAPLAGSDQPDSANGARERDAGADDEPAAEAAPAAVMAPSRNGANHDTDERAFHDTDDEEVYRPAEAARRPFFRRPLAGIATLGIVGLFGLLALTRLDDDTNTPRGPADTPVNPVQMNAIMSATALQQTIVALRPSSTPTLTPTDTATPSATPTVTEIPAALLTATELVLHPPTETPTLTPEPSNTPAPTARPTNTPIPTDTLPPPSPTPSPPTPTPQPDWLAVAAASVATAVGGGGGQLAFVSERDGNSELYRMELDGSPLERLTAESAAESDPAWSPDGSWIAFVSTREGNQEIFALESASGALLRLT